LAKGAFTLKEAAMFEILLTPGQTESIRKADEFGPSPTPTPIPTPAPTPCYCGYCGLYQAVEYAQMASMELH
jgi:hypothetical protein